MPHSRNLARWLVFWLLPVAGLAAELSDHFADRQTLADPVAVVLGSNVGATVEPGEPRHAGKPGGRSLWVSWIAPTNGLLTISTAGSTFDTLLAVYTLEEGDDPPLERLREEAEGDDEDSTPLTALGLGTQAGQRYEIAVDGFAGATGDIRLELAFFASGAGMAKIVRTPGDQALRAGDTLILTVDLVPVPELELRWHLNGEEVDDGEEPTLVVQHLEPADTGFYELELKLDDLAFFSAPIEIQLNSEGETTVLARNKLEEAAGSGLRPAVDGAAKRRIAPAAADAGVTRGYNGSQVFQTAYATRDPAEPQHCGVPGGPSYWFAYQPPADGVLRLDTEGSDYDTLLAVYTYDPPLTGFASLVSVACDDNSGASAGAARVEFRAVATRSYFIVVDGVNGARGIAHLNYALTAAEPPPAAPTITRPPQSQMVAAGSTIALTVVARGQTPLTLQWFHDGLPMNGQTNGALTLTAIQPADAGAYRAVVGNAVGSVSSEPAVIDVRSVAGIAVSAASGQARLSFPAGRGYQYLLEAAPDAGALAWDRVQTALADAGGMVQVQTSIAGVNQRFYRLLRP